MPVLASFMVLVQGGPMGINLSPTVNRQADSAKPGGLF